MSRPSVRNKNKRKRPEDEIDEKTEILRRIHSTNQITDDDLGRLYNIRKTICTGCRINTKDNPNCLCGLIPPPNGSRKIGLWQKMSDVISSLGPDPANDLRCVDGVPAGLTNLGATCYANSILQFLYMNRAFREGIFSVEPEVLKQQPVLDQLARLFAQLYDSKRAFIDSAPFIKTLELDNDVQQDSHEFLTLLLSLLEQCLRHSGVPRAKTIVQDLFRGNMSHVTSCSECGQTSEASSNVEDFYELELNVKGLKSLDESLSDYLCEEKLEGDNQYFCESCGKRVDATRSIKLRTLPPILNFQLKRCVFLQKTTTKKKITSAFSFPQELDMGQRLSDASESDLIYGLSAVLVHKGTAVNSGHYVAHIKDESSGQWWEFDDEHVSSLDDNNANVGQVQSSSVNGYVETYTSSDAYMLMYTLRSRKGNQSGLLEYNVKNNGGSFTADSDVSLPSHLAEEVRTLNASYVDACENYNSRKEREVNTMTERREEVRSVLAEAPVLSLEEPYFWISMDWLRQWADSVTASPINNNSIQCSHGKIPVSKIPFIKRISAQAWALLNSKYGGGPCLGKDANCIDCLFDSARATITADSYRDRRAVLNELAEASLAGKCSDDKLYYVSRNWLQQWLRRKASDYPSEADAGPTALIRCRHGFLKPEEAPGAKHVLVPASLWNFLHENSNLMKPDDELGCSTFASDAEICSVCYLELSEMTSLEDSQRANKIKQRQNHEKLAIGKGVPLIPKCKYYLLPSSWLSKWRNYINASGKNTSSTIEPEKLDGVIRSLVCDKHSRLLERPLDLLWKHGVVSQKVSMCQMNGLMIITENDWKNFCKEWGGREETGLKAEIEFRHLGDRNVVGSCQDMPITVENINTDENIELESREPVIKTTPEVCEDCIGERESCMLMQKLNYCNEDISVCFVRGKEAPKSIIEASENNVEADRRTSKRSRKTSFGNVKVFNVSGSTTVYQLKMMIWESFGVVKENQVLHKGSKVIEGDSDTLADVNVFSGDLLWVTDSEIHEYRDITDELSGQKVEVQRAEEGFRGTLLTFNST
ncbi:ubiquitin carboxyl-terminal hydrolase 26 isoform X2 [Silene latifolia]|uniref:ubiquitin carboxyl-terminal hydrolase 26 isoform X2 n=1 Tax=Silene latifolia TaxID=37657 RepID=UPI003D783267